MSCTKHLSPSQKDEYYSKLIDRLQDELQPAIDQTGFTVHGNQEQNCDYSEDEVAAMFAGGK